MSLNFGNVEQTPGGATYTLLSVAPTEPGAGRDDEKCGPIFLHDIHESLLAVLRASNMKLWIMLDRLDEVFPRRTELERIALRSLLRTTRNFPT